ncbi:MAG: hypothetical protein IPG74_03325 [Flavobacteriales bacterium]|nr:hypothetical protein [Flavobacteriales bacterium]
MFHNGGNPLMYLSSADLMERNISSHRSRIPLIDPALQKEMGDLLELQWSDNVKARVIDEAQTNPYRKRARGAGQIRSQVATAEWLRHRARTKVK